MNWQFGIVKTPEGKHWISCQIITQLNTYAFGMPPDAWIQTSQNLPETITKLAAECKKLDTGIVVAPPDALKNIPGQMNAMNNIKKGNRRVR